MSGRVKHLSRSERSCRAENNDNQHPLCQRAPKSGVCSIEMTLHETLPLRDVKGRGRRFLSRLIIVLNRRTAMRKIRNRSMFCARRIIKLLICRLMEFVDYSNRGGSPTYLPGFNRRSDCESFHRVCRNGGEFCRRQRDLQFFPTLNMPCHEKAVAARRTRRRIDAIGQFESG